jgi:His Kinase A (phospho-acceptor) domain
VAGPRDELKELGDTIDGLLARLEGAFAAQRRFVANASHELRTPLTTMPSRSGPAGECYASGSTLMESCTHFAN